MSNTRYHNAWWSIHGDDLFDALVRCWEGEDPEEVYVEYYANAEVGPVEPNDKFWPI